MKLKTPDLIGAALDYAVALAVIKCDEDIKRTVEIVDGRPMIIASEHGDPLAAFHFNVSANWTLIGSLIDSLISSIGSSPSGWSAIGKDRRSVGLGPTPQVAICRAIVGQRFGAEVEIPHQLIAA